MTKDHPIELPEHDIQPGDTLVFLHIPKAGGVTLGALIDPMWLPGARCPEYMTFPLARLPRAQLHQYRSFTGHFRLDALTQLLAPGFHAITMLREPTSRHLSHLRMLRRIVLDGSDPSNLPVLFQLGNPLFFQMVQNTSREDSQSPYSAWKSMTLEELVLQRSPQEMNGLIDTQTHQLVSTRRPGGATQSGQADLLVNEAIDNLGRMLCFGLMERFQDSLFLFSFVFGWQPFHDTLRHNVAPDSLQPESLPGEALDCLQAYNELDLRLYAFAREEFQRRFDWMTQTLLERHGSRNHARLQLPLSSEILFELLELHYRERFRRRHAVDGPASTSCYTFDQPLDSGSGWQRLEVMPAQGPFRWTGPGTIASLDLPPLAGGDVELGIGLLEAINPDLFSNLQVLVNGMPLEGEWFHDPAGGKIFKIIAPCKLIEREPFLRVTLQTGSTGSPHASDPGNPDTRLLGMAVNRVEQKLL